MCIQTIYTLPCGHVRSTMTYCSRASTKLGPDGQRRPCSRMSSAVVPNPPPAGVDPRSIPRCSLNPCPYEARGGCWNCCWCGKTWNTAARCSSVKIGDAYGTRYPCDHLCCETCTAAGPL